MAVRIYLIRKLKFHFNFTSSRLKVRIPEKASAMHGCSVDIQFNFNSNFGLYAATNKAWRWRYNERTFISDGYKLMRRSVYTIFISPSTAHIKA
jgi:uncharacterized protein YxjI